MATSATIEFLKRTTESLIEWEPTPIRLTHPPQMLPNGRGGLTRSGAPQTEPEAVNRFFSATTPTERVAIENEGREVIIDWVLVGTFDDDIREGDTFTVNGIEYKVWTVLEDRRWQTKGLVSRA